VTSPISSKKLSGDLSDFTATRRLIPMLPISALVPAVLRPLWLRATRARNRSPRTDKDGGGS
jgi:hypothetical protein